MLELEWEPTAVTDPMSVVDYISDHNLEAAQVLKNDIEASVSGLREHPRLYRVGRVAGTREMVVRSNYVVVYAVDVHAVTISACFTELGNGHKHEPVCPVQCRVSPAPRCLACGSLMP